MERRKFRRRRAYGQRAVEIVDQLTLPDPWDAETLISGIAEQNERPIHLIAQPSLGSSVTGTIMSLDAMYLILYREDLRGWHRDHVLCHEIGHLLAGHLGDGPDAYEPGGARPDNPLARAGRNMLMRQCAYGEWREQEAEDVAELILARVKQNVASSVLTPDKQRVVRGFGSALR